MSIIIFPEKQFNLRLRHSSSTAPFFSVSDQKSLFIFFAEADGACHVDQCDGGRHANLFWEGGASQIWLDTINVLELICFASSLIHRLKLREMKHCSTYWHRSVFVEDVMNRLKARCINAFFGSDKFLHHMHRDLLQIQSSRRCRVKITHFCTVVSFPRGQS